jgi:hypothetical protein
MGSARWRGALFVRTHSRSRTSLLKVAAAHAQARSRALRFEAEQRCRQRRTQAVHDDRVIGISRWKIEQKKRFDQAPRGGLRAGDALYDSKRFSRVKLTGIPFV